jgi:site-specific recombinase XerD
MLHFVVLSNVDIYQMRESQHSLRNDADTWLSALGVSSRNLQALLGHQTSTSTDIYVHAVD